ncbi:CPBP family intramembrane metalloprotease [Streptomyces oryzae]|uniref:CPBP family intramembrane metalloprotease n=2 Tax=Streptomyces oryzae TaxID=1434886 RepID=A0ABS3XJE7_9ACTN|nr:CPBP family intramembrane metalloprotease [Streptomyces oryzae]
MGSDDGPRIPCPPCPLLPPPSQLPLFVRSAVTVSTTALPRPSSPTRAARTRGLVVFFAIAFGASWLCMIGVRLAGLSLVNPLAQLSFAFLPAIGALVARRVSGEGFADAGLALRLREQWRWYLAAWLCPLLLAFATIGLAAALGVPGVRLSALDGLIPGLPGWAGVTVLMAVVPLLTPVYWGEEFGWTSYLRPRLYRAQLSRSVLATGLIWALWHYPLAFLGYIEFADPLLGLALWTCSFLVQETLLALLYLRSGTIWTASLAHAGNNMVLALLVGTVLKGSDATTLTWLPILPLAALSAIALLAARRGRAMIRP